MIKNNLFSLQTHYIRFSHKPEPWSGLEIVNRTTGQIVDSESLQDRIIEIKLDTEDPNGLIGLIESPGLTGPGVIAKSISLSEKSGFEIDTRSYTGIGTSDLRDIMKDWSIFHLDLAFFTLQLASVPGNMIMTGKPKAPSGHPIYYELEREDINHGNPKKKKKKSKKKKKKQKSKKKKR